MDPRGIAMFGKDWCTSERQYGVRVERDVRIPLSDGISLSCDVFRPDARGKFPALLGYHPYINSGQSGPIKPTVLSTGHWRLPGQESTNASIEAGDPYFFARRGYVHVICNVRGTGKSEGKWQFAGAQEHKDGHEAIEWTSRQPWCTGNVGMFGVSYFAWIQYFVASTQPPHLKCLFAPWGATDFYRDIFYRGGVPAYGWPIGWARTSFAYSNARPDSQTRKELGDKKYLAAIKAALQDEDIRLAPELPQILANPDAGINPFIVDLILHPTYDRFWQERTVNYDLIKVPAYTGASWGMFGIHLPAAFRTWEKLKVPKKMLIGPFEYLDRPLFQLHYEALRWFDHWLKGMDNGIMQEPPVRMFVTNTGEWKEARAYPLPETRWTPFFLHEKGLLSEHEHWPNEGSDSFEDSPWGRGSLTYTTPPMVENTEVTGPATIKFYASSTDYEVFWIVSLLEISPEGKSRLLSKGWLRASHRKTDTRLSKPWQPFRRHAKAEPLIPNETYEFEVPIVPISILLRAGYRLAIRISCVDDEPNNPLEFIACGDLRRQSPSRLTVYHDADHPSHLLLPITKGNILGTFMSGGKFA